MKKYVTWAEVEDYVQKLKTHCDKLGFIPGGIYGPARGAIPFREITADVMGISKRLTGPKRDAIHIDDIADSGMTLEAIKKRKTNSLEYNDPTKNRDAAAEVGDFFITTMYYHPRSTVKPDFYVANKNSDAQNRGLWVVFPYEEINQREKDVKLLQTQIAKNTGKINVTWEQIEGFLFETMHRFEEKGIRPAGVYGERNGGEVLAVWFSNGYDIDMLDAPCEGCLVLSDFAQSNENKDCYTIAMFGKKNDDNGMFKVVDYDSVVMPYKRKKCESREKLRTVKQKLPVL